MMTDAVFINPPSSGAVYQDLAHDLSAIEPPTWLRMVAGCVRDAGFEVAVIDADALRLTPDEVLERVEGLEPTLVVYVAAGQQPSASTQTMAGIAEVASWMPGGILQFAMGHHPSALPEETMRMIPMLDGVIDGEGCLSIPELLRGRLHAPGIHWPMDRRVDPRMPYAPPLRLPADQMHGDVWDLLPMDRYRAHNWQCLDGSSRHPYASIYTSLGCPYRCHFCMINVIQHSNAYRVRSPGQVVDQVRHLHDVYAVLTLKIADEMFILRPSHYRPICEGLAALPFADRLNIWAYARIDTIKAEDMDLLRRAGIRWLALGIESGSEHVRDGAKKALRPEDIIRNVEIVRAAGINIVGNFIFGLPDDTHETMTETFNLALEVMPEWANFYSAMPYPGSPLYDATLEEHRPQTWSGYSQHSYDCQPLPTTTLSARDVLRERDRAFIRYYRNPTYLDMIGRKFGAPAVEEIQRMERIPLPRKLLGA